MSYLDYEPSGLYIRILPHRDGATHNAAGELPRIHIPRTRVNKRLLACLLALPACIRAQPKRDVGRLHRIPYYTYQIIAQCVQICLVAQLG